MVQSLPANAGDTRDSVSIPGLGRTPGVGMATQPSILAWRLPWTEEPGGLKPMGSQRVKMTERLSTHTESTGGAKECRQPGEPSKSLQSSVKESEKEQHSNTETF